MTNDTLSTDSPAPGDGNRADNVLFDISAQLDKPRYFGIDGNLYELRDIRHLSPTDEAKFRTLARRDTITQQEVDDAIRAGKIDEAEAISLKQRDYQISLIVLMTTVPLDVARKLDLGGRGMILRAIQGAP